MKGLSTKITSLLLMMIAAIAANAQQSTIHGKITTSDGKPAAGVNITLKESKKTVISAEDGTYSITTGKECDCSLLVTFTGLKTVEKKVVVRNDENIEVNFRLEENAGELEDVIVSSSVHSNRRPTSLDKAGIRPLDMPQASGVVSSKVIADQQANRLGDVVKNVSGVSLTQTRQGVAETFSARGYSIGIGGAGGSIFKNGIITNTMGFPEASALESVEVLKGSSALLYGNTSGGVIINMVTKKPKFEKGGEVSMRYGSYNLYKPTVDVYGPLSKNLAYRVVGTYENADSYRDNVKTKRTYVNPSLLYNLGKKTTLLLQGDYLHANFTPDNGIGVLNQNMDAIIPASRSRFINFAWAYYHLNQATASLKLDHTFNDRWKFNFIAGAQGTKVDAYASNVPNSIAANGDFVRTLNRTKTFENDYTLQFNFIGDVKTAFLKHHLLIGADAVRVKTGTNTFGFYNNGISVSNAYDTLNIFNPSMHVVRADIPEARDTLLTESPSNRLGVYVQDMISITNKVKVLAGVRWSYLKNLQTNILNRVTDVKSHGTAAAVENKAFSPKVALIYQPVNTSSIYVSYANNFTTNSGVDIYGAQLEPSIIDQYEAGIKNELFKGKIFANVSVYRIINHNFAQMAQYKADGTINSDANVKELSGETTSDGFEIDFSGSLSNNFYFITGYGYNHMRYTKTSGLKGSNIEGEQLINNPRHTANATISYTFDHTVLKGLKLGASAFYTGKRMGGSQNTHGQSDYNRLIPLSDFTTIDISAGYAINKVSLQAKLSNITNTLNYLGHDRYSINPIAPRQFSLTAAYKW